jgi:hypothetical protein
MSWVPWRLNTLEILGNLGIPDSPERTRTFLLAATADPVTCVSGVSGQPEGVYFLWLSVLKPSPTPDSPKRKHGDDLSYEKSTLQGIGIH